MTDTLDTDQSPLEGKQPIAVELRQIRRAHNALVQEHVALKNEFYEHSAMADTAYVGGDRRGHHDHHKSEIQKQRDRREFWSKVLPQVFGGIAIAVATLIGVSLLFFIRNGGP
jgi:hypothetical protein